jgi:hypothetical protein
VFVWLASERVAVRRETHLSWCEKRVVYLRFLKSGEKTNRKIIKNLGKHIE